MCLKQITWFNYQEKHSDVWNVERFMCELTDKVNALFKPEDCNLISLLKFYAPNRIFYQALDTTNLNQHVDKIVNHFREQKINDIYNDTNYYFNLNYGKLNLMGMTGNDLRMKIDFLHYQWSQVPLTNGKLNLKSYEVITKLASFLSALSVFTSTLHLAYIMLSPLRFMIEIIQDALHEIFHYSNGDNDIIDKRYE